TWLGAANARARAVAAAGGCDGGSRHMAGLKKAPGTNPRDHSFFRTVYLAARAGQSAGIRKGGRPPHLSRGVRCRGPAACLGAAPLSPTAWRSTRLTARVLR